MPALKLDTWRPSECPIHGPVHAIWLDGHYGRWSAYQERTRYTCVRFDEAGKRLTHRFTPSIVIRRPTDCVPRSGEGETQGDGDPERPDEGRTAHASTFTIPEIARLLVSVGEGKPLRGCAHELRGDAYRRHCLPNSGRARPKLEPKSGALPDAPRCELPARPNRPARSVSRDLPSPRESYNYSALKVPRRVDSSRSASTAMDYVDQYGPVILRDIAPERWPIYIALGSVPVARQKRDRDSGAALTVPGGEIMIAADCELPGHGYAFHARFGGGSDKDSWIDFFRTLTGEPTWIVAARNDGLSEAVADHWPNTVLFACEDHLRDALRDAARADGILEKRPERGPLFDEIRGAFRDLVHWQEFVDVAEALAPAGPSRLRGWLDDNEAFVLSQFFLKKQYRSAPTEDGPVRPAMAEIRKKLLQRSGSVRNLWRLNLRLALMCAHWSELDREREYAAALDRHFASLADPARARRMVSRPDWASGRDYGGARSIDDFLAESEMRREAARNERARLESAPSPRPVSRNAARVAVGLPPILTPPVEEPQSVPVAAPSATRPIAPAVSRSKQRRRSHRPVIRSAPVG